MLGRKSRNCNHNPPECMKQLFNVWSGTSSDWNTVDNCITTGTDSQDAPNCKSELSITNPRNSSMTAIRRIATAYLWNRIPRILHLLRADFYYGGFHNGVTPPNSQMAITPCGREHLILIWKHTFYWNKYVWTRNRLDQYDLDKVRLSYQNLIQCIGTV